MRRRWTGVLAAAVSLGALQAGVPVMPVLAEPTTEQQHVNQQGLDHHHPHHQYPQSQLIWAAALQKGVNPQTRYGIAAYGVTNATQAARRVTGQQNARIGVEEHQEADLARFQNRAQAGRVTALIETLATTPPEPTLYPTAVPGVETPGFLMPTQGWKSSDFGMRLNPISHKWRLHAGVDIAAPGGTPIRAVANGEVRKAGWGGGYGYYTCLYHGLYQGQELTTCYAHQSEILVEKGQRVWRGQIIGRVGTTGASTGNHLHFEVRLDDTPVNPLEWLPECLC